MVRGATLCLAAVICVLSITVQAVALDVPAMRPGETGLSGYLSCLRGKTTLISAHRGGVEPGFPENAIETIENTLEFGPMLIEVDVVTSADNVLFLMHDKTLDRTTTGTGAVTEADWSSVRELQLKDNDGTVTPYKVPRLRDALRWAKGRAVLLLDVKRSTSMDDIVRVVTEEDALDRVIVIAYSLEDTMRVLNLSDRLMVSTQIESNKELKALEDAKVDFSRILAWTGIQAIAPHRIIDLHQKGVSVSFGTLWYIDGKIAETGDESLYGKIAALGVDILATDRHKEAYSVVQDLGGTVEAVRACNGEHAAPRAVEAI